MLHNYNQSTSHMNPVEKIPYPQKQKFKRLSLAAVVVGGGGGAKVDIPRRQNMGICRPTTEKLPRALPSARNQQCKAKTRTNFPPNPPRFFPRSHTTFASLSNPCVVPALRSILSIPTPFFQERPIAPDFISIESGVFRARGGMLVSRGDLSQPRKKKNRKMVMMTFCWVFNSIRCMDMRGYREPPEARILTSEGGLGTSLLSCFMVIYHPYSVNGFFKH